MVDPGGEGELGGLERIVGGEVDVEEKYSTCRKVILWPLLPMVTMTIDSPSKGESEGPKMVACQWKGSSPAGPAEHWAGGSFIMSFNSFMILF